MILSFIHWKKNLSSLWKSHHRTQGSTCWDGLSWSSQRTHPSCSGRVQWRWWRSSGGCRYCWTSVDSRAFGSESKKPFKWPRFLLLTINYEMYWSTLSYHFIILHQHHVIGAQSSNEDDTGDTFETMNPLLSLWPLATHIKHSGSKKTICCVITRSILIPTNEQQFVDSPEVKIFEGELSLNDTSGFHSWSQHILLSGHIAWLDQSLQVIEVAVWKLNSVSGLIFMITWAVFNFVVAYYPAESLSWYSEALSKQTWMPESFHRRRMMSDNSLGMVPSSMVSARCISFLASSCRKDPGGQSHQ